MLVATTTDLYLPAFDTILASCSWNFALRTECVIASFSRIFETYSDVAISAVPIRIGCQIS
jgi:hypothetical protein